MTAFWGEGSEGALAAPVVRAAVAVPKYNLDGPEHPLPGFPAQLGRLGVSGDTLPKPMVGMTGQDIRARPGRKREVQLKPYTVPEGASAPSLTVTTENARRFLE